MQKELVEVWKRRAQAQMDKVLRQRRERKRLKRKQCLLAAISNHFLHYRFAVKHPMACSELINVYLIRICIISRKNEFINTYDISVKGKKMSTKKKTQQPKKVDFLELSSSKKARLLKKAKENLRQKLREAEFWQSFAKTERITINGQTIQF
jgi:hypothetical protein